MTLLGMLGSSTLFRHTPLRWSNYRWFLRRLDHAAIFLFIAGTYTPFTVGQMHEERVGPTVAVWAGALIGAAYKLAFPVGLRRSALVAFAALASFVLFGLRPTLVSMAPPAVGLIVAGVALYMVAATIHYRPMPFHTPIWHGFVIIGAAWCWCPARAVLRFVDKRTKLAELPIPANRRYGAGLGWSGEVRQCRQLSTSQMFRHDRRHSAVRCISGLRRLAIPRLATLSHSQSDEAQISGPNTKSG